MPTSLRADLFRTDRELRSRFHSLNSLSDVADLLEVPAGYLRRLLYIRGDRAQYRHFDIPKRAGGVRHISAPSTALAILQSKLNHVLKLVYRPKRAVQGFLPGGSIVSNAEQHVGKRWVLNVDLKDFFPSINFGRVRGALMAPPYGVPAKPATVIAQICTSDNQLPQGAPSSPMFSNIVCGRLDGELESLARRFRLTYTRYCDDLTLSARSFSFPSEIAFPAEEQASGSAIVGLALRSVIEANGFFANEHKTTLQFRDCHQEVTGLVVNEFVNVRRSLVKEVRAMLHAWARYGLSDASSTFIDLYARHEYRTHPAEEAFRQVLKGKIEFIGQIRGSRDFVYARLRGQLHELDPRLIGPAPRDVTRPPTRGGANSAGDMWHRWFLPTSRAVRQLEITMSDGSVHSGTTFILRRGVLATAAHNLGGEVSVIDASGSARITEALLHPTHGLSVDCALLRYGTVLPSLQTEWALPDVGEPIAAIGFATIPQRFPACGLYTGQVEAITVNYANNVTLIQVSLPGAGGLSGSPVINRFGRVIGIVIQSVFEQTEPGVPHREFLTVLPIGYATSIPSDAESTPVPIAGVAEIS